MIKVLHKAFDLLESMSAQKSRAFTLSELSAMIHEKPTTCANIVKTLCDRGYLCRVEPKGYVLGPVAQGLNYVDAADTRLVEAARAPMQTLVRQYGATGVLAVLRRGKKKILDDYKSEGELVINKTVRADHELYTTSTGLVLTMQEKKPPTKEKAALVERTYGSLEAFLQLREKIKQDGYVAISLSPRVFQIAVPIFKNSEVYAAVAAYLPEFLLNEQEKQTMIQNLCAIAHEIEERI